VGDYTVSEVSNEASANYVLPADKTVTILADKTTVAEMLCKKYGIDTRDSYDCSKLGGIFAGKEVDVIKADLRDMENAMDSINSRMAKVLYQGKDKSRSSRTDHER